MPFAILVPVHTGAGVYTMIVIKRTVRAGRITGALVICLILAAASLPVPRQAAAEDAVQVVYHADFSDPRRFSAMLTSINNMMNYYENELVEADVRIVFVAHGIRFLTDDGLADTPFAEDAELKERRANLKGRLLSQAETRGVKLELCDITRTQVGLPESAVYDHVSLVPSGVVRIAELQHQGFAYIKVE